MPTIGPPSVPPPAGAPPAPTPLITVPRPPPQLAALPQGATLQATVTAALAKGVVQLKAPFGDFTATAQMPLPKGAAVALQVQALQPQLQLAITAVNGRPVPQATNAAAGTAANPAGQGAPTPGGSMPASGPSGPLAAGPGAGGLAARGLAAAGDRVTPGNGLWATVVRAQPPAAQGRVGQQAWSVPTAMAQTASRPDGPVRGQAAQGGSAAQGGTVAQGRAAAPSVTALSGAGRARPLLPLPPGSQLEVRIVSTAPPGQPRALPPTDLAPRLNLAPGVTGSLLSATATGTTPAGQTVVTTSLGSMALPTRSASPPGTTMVLEVTHAATTAKADAAQAAGGAPAPPAAHGRSGWPAVEQAAMVLDKAAPEAAQHLMQTVMPRPDPGVAANVLFFLAALQGGNLRQWLGGPAMRILERHAPDVARRLGDDMKAMGRTVGDSPAGGEWRVFMVPFHAGPHVEQVRICMRRPQGEGEDEEEKKRGARPGGTRFVVDAHLSALGRLQLDGLAKQDRRSVELIVRSEAALPADMRREINAIFTRTLEGLGHGGRLSFQAGRQFVEVEGVDVAAHPLGLDV